MTTQGMRSVVERWPPRRGQRAAQGARPLPIVLLNLLLLLLLLFVLHLGHH